MQSVQVQITTEQLYEAIKRLPLKERRKLRRQLDESSAIAKPQRNGHRRKTHEEMEADLLDRIRINSSLPDAAQSRYKRLRRKLQDETISKEDLKELQLLTSRFEAMAVERLASVIELARLRGQDFDTTWQELGLDKIQNVS